MIDAVGAACDWQAAELGVNNLWSIEVFLSDGNCFFAFRPGLRE